MFTKLCYTTSKLNIATSAKCHKNDTCSGISNIFIGALEVGTCDDCVMVCMTIVTYRNINAFKVSNVPHDTQS